MSGYRKNKLNKKVLAWLLMVNLGVQPILTAVVFAQSVAVPDKNQGLNPNISQAANGTTVVDIRTPNQHGLSHNQYLDMQVDKSGIIFNNSGKISQTQLAGYINANPYLAGTYAKVILNEVTGRLPTSVNGYLEVAGNQASLILANPNGIVGNNFGFINVDRATLTTGKPQFTDNGSLNNFLVNGGDIQINGSGMEARTARQTDIIANAVKINAGLWANELNIVTGKNEVNYQTQEVKKIADSNNGVSLDVAAIGGMYAGRIKLIGTAQGVGVNNQGTINADNSDLVLEQTGKIYAKGSMHAKNNITIKTDADIEQAGTLYAENNLLLNSANFSNSGKIKADKTFTTQVQNQIKNTDTIEACDMDIVAGGIFINNNQIQTENGMRIQVSGNIKNTKDFLVNGTLDLLADNLENNINGRIIASETQLVLNDTLDNTGLLNSADTVIRAQTVNNIDTGRIYGDHIAIGAGTLNNVPGSANIPVIAARQHLDLGVDTINNKEHAVITSMGDLHIGGKLNDDDVLIGKAGSINNNSATIEAGGNLTISADTINNTNEHFSTEVQEVGRESITEYQGGGQSARYKAGTPGVYEYTSESIHLHTPEGNFEDWTKYVYERIIKEDVIIETDPGKILAGGNIAITANTVINDKSQITAGSRLDAAILDLQNIEAPGKRYYYDSGQVIFYSRHYQSGHDSTNIDPYPYNPAATINNITVTAGKYTGNTVPETSGSKADEFKPGLNDITKIPASSLYIVVQDSNNNYFIETDPAFADYKSWISSDYFFEKMQSDPEKTAKRLGDGYYEQQLVKNQVLQLTGKRYTGTYKSDEQQYKALLDNAVAFAQNSNAQIGVALTEQQIAELKTDIVWMVEQSVILPSGEIVSALVPQVYIKNTGEQFAGNAVLSAQDVDFKITNDILNEGTIIAGNTAKIAAGNINNNNGTITGSNIVLDALQDINNNGGKLTAQNNLQLTAGRDITIASTASTQVNEQGHTTNISAVGSVAVTGNEGSLTMSAGRDVNLTAASVENAGSGATDITAKNNIKLGTVNISESHDLVLDADNQRHDNASMDIGTGISVKGSLNLQAGNDFNAKAAAVQSENDLNVSAGGNINIVAGRSTANAVDDRKDVGKSGGGNTQITYTHSETHENNAIGSSFSGKNINLEAGKDANVVSGNITSDGSVKITAAENINITGSEETVSSLNTMNKKKSGMFGSERKKVYDAGEAVLQAASTISGGSVDLASGKDTNIVASNVVADNDVNIKAGSNVNIVSNIESQSGKYTEEVKKSGLLSGGGLGFTIGSEKRKDQYDNQNVEQAGSTVGSISGSVNVEAGKDVSISASDVLAGKDINLIGQNVTIESADNTYNAQEKHEYKKSGLTVAIGGQALDKVNEAIGHIERAGQVEDDRLAALHAYKAYDTVKDNIGMIKDAVNDPAGNLSLNVSIGTQKNESHSDSTTIIAQGSNVKAVGDVNITATEKDINIKGSNVEGENVSLKAKEDINITASDNTNTTEQNSKSSSASVGVGVDLTTGHISSVNIGGSKGKGEVKVNGTTYNESTVTAKKDLSFTSGEDANIKGGILSGEKVTGNVGGDLNIESKQDSNRYEENNSSSSIGIGIDITGKGTSNKTGIFGGVSQGNMDSSYDSVTDQSGIYAGKEGFDIIVGDNTDLKGGIIDSKADADKNKISTGTLTFEDIHNKAEYEADNKGFGIDTSKDAKKENAGITPNLGMLVADKTESDTKATIAEGEIEIRDKEKQKQDITELNRDTKNSLNKLEEIFDRNTVSEKQEFASLFQEVAHSAIGDLTGKISAEEKAALNVFVDGMISSWLNGDFLAGASGTALVESMQSTLNNIEDPALRQIAAGLLGAAISEALTGKGQAGGSSAISTEKYNELKHQQVENKMDLVDKIISDNSLTKKEKEEKIKIVEEVSKTIERSQQDVLEEHGYKHWSEVPSNQIDSLLQESDKLVQQQNGFNYLKSIGVNATTTIADLPLDMAGKAKFLNLGIWTSGSVLINLNKDAKEYSGVDFIIASGIDVAAPIAAAVVSSYVGLKDSTGDALKDPFTSMTKIVIKGVTFGIMGDVVAQKLKDDWAKTDIEKIYDQIKGVY